MHSPAEKNGNWLSSKKSLAVATGLVAALGAYEAAGQLPAEVWRTAQIEVTNTIELGKIEFQMRRYEREHAEEIRVAAVRSAPLVVSGTLSIDTPQGQCTNVGESGVRVVDGPCRPGASATVSAPTPK